VPDDPGAPPSGGKIQVSAELLLNILERAIAGHEAALEAVGIGPGMLAAFYARRCALLLARVEPPMRERLVGRVQGGFAAVVDEYVRRNG
jgi:hypothetical protein